MQAIAAVLTLDLPWIEPTKEQMQGLVIRRGLTDTLAYDDGIVLEVHVLDPARYDSPTALVGAARAAARPGRVILIAGAVPVSWRPILRKTDMSFVDVSGVAEISWPRLHVSTRRFGQSVKRPRAPLPFQKGYSLVVQELLAVTTDGARPTIGELAEGAGVSLATASRAISQLADHGLVVKEREGTHVSVDFVDRVGIAKRLAERTAWPGDEMVGGYFWGRTVFDLAARISAAAAAAEVQLAITGRVGAAYYGVLGTSSPRELRCWVDVTTKALPEIAEQLGLEPAEHESANVLLSADAWRFGTHRLQVAQFDEFEAAIAHPVRVWCDLHSEQRGTEYAAQLWGTLVHGR